MTVRALAANVIWKVTAVPGESVTVVATPGRLPPLEKSELASSVGILSCSYFPKAEILELKVWSSLTISCRKLDVFSAPVIS